MNIFSAISKYKTIPFEDSIHVEKTNSTRVLVIVGSALYGIYSIIDLFGMSQEMLMILFPPRLANLLLYAGIYALTYKQAFFQKYYNSIGIIGYSSSGLAICFAIYVAQENHYSYGMYFAALMVLIYMSFTWSYLPIKYTLIMNSCIIITYTLIKSFVHKEASGEHFLTFIGQIFYLISFLTVAATAQLIRDNLIKKNLLLQNRLELIAKAKTKEAEKQQALANLDVLTGIPNRRFITECLRKEIALADKNNTQLTLVFIDLNGFKRINDNHGHDAGDRVLEITAQRLKQAIRKGDYVARLGGDEFLISFKTARYSSKLVNAFCNKLRLNVAEPIAFNGKKFKVSTSIGIANYPGDGDSVEELIKISDKHMYIDKQEGKIMRANMMSQNLV